MHPLLRHAYPGVAPWEWEANPLWFDRVMTGLLGEFEARQMKKQAGEGT